MTAPLTPPPFHPAIDRENPWPGLAPFTEDQRAFFFGRETESAELFRLIRRSTLTVLFGQSGLGKSSLLQAGVFPLLREADFLPVAVRLDHGPDAVALADQVKAALRQAYALVGADASSPSGDETLWQYFHRQGTEIWSAKNRLLTPVLVFDQFEELFTLGRATEAARGRARAFVVELADLTENREPLAVREQLERGEIDPSVYAYDQVACHVVLSLREDYLPDLEGLRGELRSLQQSRFRLRRLDGLQALEIATKPAPHLLAPGVAEKIVEFVAGGRGGSPERLQELEVEPALLSVVCRELNQRRIALGHEQITAYLVSGNREEILAEFYARSTADLRPAVRTFVEDRLLTRSGFRDNLALETALAEPGVSRADLDALVSRRLLRMEDRLGVPRVELTHDVLAEVIRRSRDARRAQEALAAEQAQLRAAQAAFERERAEKLLARRQTVRARLIAGVCAGLAVGAIVSALFGYFSVLRARTAEAAAQAAEATARAAETKAVRVQALAEQSRGDTEQIISYLIDDLREDLEPLGRLKLLERLLQPVLLYYDNLPAELRTPDNLRNRAIVFARMGAISSTLVDVLKSDERYAKAIASLDARPNDTSDAQVLARAEVLSLQATSYVLETRYPQCDILAQRAEDLVKPLVERPRGPALVWKVAVDAAEAVAHSLQNVRPDTAIPAFELSLARLNEYAQRVPNDPHTDQKRAYLLSRILYAAARANRPELAEASGKQALEMYRVLAKADPSNVTAKVGISSSLFSLSRLYNEDHQPDKALALAQEANAIARQVLENDPQNGGSKNGLLISMSVEADALVRLGRIKQSVQTRLESVTLFPSDEKLANLTEGNLARGEGKLAETLSALGDLDEARGHLAKAADRRQQLATVHADESHAENIDEAIAATINAAAALAAGDFVSARRAASNAISKLSVVHTNDPNLTALRDVPLVDAELALGRSAANQRLWPDGEKALRSALDHIEANPHAVRSNSAFGIWSNLALEAQTKTWLAWIEANLGKAEEARTLAATALNEDVHERQISGAEKDAQLQLDTAFAEVALARARIAGHGNPQEIQAVLAEAGRLLETLPEEFKATSWVRDVKSKFEETSALVR